LALEPDRGAVLHVQVHPDMGTQSSLGVAAALAVALIAAGNNARAEELRTLTLEPSPDLPPGPDPLLVTTGIVIFGAPYGFSAFAAATSNLSSDKWLYAPVVGPWGDLIARLTCTSSDCKGDLGTASLPLIISGLGQAAGVGILIKALIDPPGKSGARSASSDTHVHVVPATYAGGAGLQAYGAF
jgi:hypothetical protein